MEIPWITIENKTLEMNINSSVLDSIVTHNISNYMYKQFKKEKCFILIIKVVTFTTGACVNTFELEKPFALLLNSRLVNLFKLFKNDLVKFSLGYDPIVKQLFKQSIIWNWKYYFNSITGCDDKLLSQVPVDAIREELIKLW